MNNLSVLLLHSYFKRTKKSIKDVSAINSFGPAKTMKIYKTFDDPKNMFVGVLNANKQRKYQYQKK